MKVQTFIQSRITGARLVVYSAWAKRVTKKALRIRDQWRTEFPELIIETELVE
ncbi:MAG: hypothetical protein M0R06_02920 [Sphaerochaeta sp.]|jgi:hypothetical protein|nr:hypothetical protein [Sphaerochaeta sp.]